jgi:tetratricopeptide (TPR) repeat protein
MHARIWEEEVIIPTYKTGEPNANPMFFENRVYQGSSGRVYPYPIIETVGDVKYDQPYTAIFLENNYLKVMVLPELGGRIHRILDKTTGEEAVYYNEVIKPALVGLLGPWISGGIEFNWPQHHRPTTFMPVDYQTKEDASKHSVSIQLHDTDRMYGTTSTATITLYEDKAYVEITGQLYNPTQFPQTFLWWANPAIAVNDHTQSIFPPDVHAVMDHGKRDVSTFPIATGIYYKHDYSEGVDISRYKNIPVPTSYMAYHSDYDFVGSYDHQKQTGILHIADHHISPGKKQWTWGCGDFGKAWDRNLTDENGPYVELMTGVFTDNQPDFTFLEPGEEKTFKQYFLPYKKAPRVINATKDVVLSLDEQKKLSLYASSEVSQRLVVTSSSNGVLFDKQIILKAAECFETTLPEAAHTISLYANDGERLLSSNIQNRERAPDIPDPAKAIPAPENIDTVEELYLAAVHLEQYRHATFRSEPYYQEALKRDPKDYRCTTGYGELLLKRGLFERSEKLFRTAIERATKHNPNPIDSKAYTLLGLSLFHQERFEEAYDAFYKAIWDGKQQEQGFLYLGILELRKKHYREAATFLEKSLIRNSHNLKTRDYLSFAELQRGNREKAEEIIRETLEIDPFDALAHDLRADIKTAKQNTTNMYDVCSLGSYRLLTLAGLYAEIGMYEKAFALLPQEGVTNPMVLYSKAHYSTDPKETENLLAQAESLEDSTYFPNTLDDLKILTSLASTHRNLWKVHYLIGTYWYDKREHEQAKESWEQANKSNPEHAKTLRCLSLVYFNQEGDPERARVALERAFSLDSEDDRLLFELDQLYKKLGRVPEERKVFLEQHSDLVFRRDDLMIEYITLLNLTKDYERARKLEFSYSFHPWEGGEGKIATQYVITQVELAKKQSDPEKAKDLLNQALTYPENLHEGKLEGNKDNEVHYLLGCLFEQENNHELAVHHWNLATRGLLTASGAMYYYDQSPHQILYKGLALRKLGREQEATSSFDELLRYGKEHMDDEVSIDYFAVSLPDLQVFTEDLSKRNRIHCLFLIGLGNLGKNNKKEAEEAFKKVLEMDPGHSEGRRMV